LRSAVRSLKSELIRLLPHTSSQSGSLDIADADRILATVFSRLRTQFHRIPDHLRVLARELILDTAATLESLIDKTDYTALSKAIIEFEREIDAMTRTDGPRRSNTPAEGRCS